MANQWINFKRGCIILAVALLTKNLLNYLFPFDNDNTDDEKPLTVFPKDFFTTRPADDKKIYLGFLGNVYDVTKGDKFYAPGGSYSFFAGKDATRAFATGDFVNDLNDNIEDFDDRKASDLLKWKKTYDDEYTWLGKLEGAFHDINGNPSKVLQELYKKVESFKEKEDVNVKFNNRFPACNSQWSGDTNTNKFWCSNKSGGVDRKWVGKPRKVFNSFYNSDICACVKDEDLDHPSIKLYEGCNPKASECTLVNK